MADGIAILVRIGLRPNGHADHPDWDRLTDALGGAAPERHQIVKWMYDHGCGHDEAREGGPFDSPAGTQLGMMVVSQEFATAAAAEFPTLVQILTPAQAAEFHDNHHAVRQPEFDMDRDELLALDAEKRLTNGANPELDARIAKALDPDDQTPGKRRNRRKTLALAMEARGFNVVDPR